MDPTKYIGKGYSGLRNLGNTCFINSCLQILSHTYELHELFNEKLPLLPSLPSSTSSKDIVTAYNDLRNIMWSQNCVVSPNGFLFMVHKIATEKHKDIFTGFAQNDVTEFLHFIIENFHEAFSRSTNVNVCGVANTELDKRAVKCFEELKTVYEKEYSEIMDLFYGMYVSEIISTSPPYNSLVIKPEQFFLLDLPVPFHEPQNEISLYDCFQMFTMMETLDGDNQWYNETTKEKEVVHKKYSFWSFPPILIIMLKRFSPDGSRKSNKRVVYPIENLDLSPYVNGYLPESYKYDLYGVSNHIGGVLGGHYTSFVKNISGEWLHFNDDQQITKVPHPEVNVVTPMAYCLFYRKKTLS
jgi:ubiquitin carboxyl-terminal hydrolase 8